MTKPEALKIIKLLSALECAGLMREKPIPDYIWDELGDCMSILTKIVLEEKE